MEMYRTNTETLSYGGLFVPFRYFVLSSFRLALWRGAKTK